MRFFFLEHSVRLSFLQKGTLWLALMLFGATMAGCAEAPENLWLNAPGWSRARHIGDTATGDPPVFALSPDGVAAFLMASSQSGRYFPAAVAIDADGQVLWEKQFEDIAMARPDAPAVYWAENAFQLFWMSNESLYHAQLDRASGEMMGAPQKLSQDYRVGHYSVAVDPQGRLVVWFAGPRPAPGLYRLPAGELTAKPLLVDGVGVTPTVRFDATGMMHVVWAQHPAGDTRVTFLYIASPSDDVSLEDALVMKEVKSALGSFFTGPIMGITANDVYLFWIVEVRTGLAAGAVDARYSRFPLGHPQDISKPVQLFAPADYHAPYQDWLAGDFRAGKRAPLFSPKTGKVTQLYANSAPRAELVTIQRELVSYTMRDTRFQTGVFFFDDGQPTSYQLLSFTGGDSRSPYIISDADAYLYAAWLERGHRDGFRIVYASTNPELKEAYGRLSSEDYKTLLAQTLFGLISGAILLPFAFMWMIVPVTLYLITFPLRRNQTELLSPGIIASLTIAIMGYWIAKIGFLGGLMGYVPFSAWLPVIPNWMALPLQLGIPAIILALGLWLAWLATYKRQTYSSLLFLIVYLGVDAVLSTAIYGPLLLATN